MQGQDPTGARADLFMTASAPFVVALTGGIASGKTAAADRFAKLGADVIDADAVARELVAPGSAALIEIVAAFGDAALDATGALDRRAMRERIFADASARMTLEGILHPRIRSTLRARAVQTVAPYVMLVIPLLAENARYAWVDRVLVVDVERATQKERLLHRDGITPTLADAMLDAQASREQRLALADDVIGNDGSLQALDARVAELHAFYLQRASAERDSAT